MKERREPYLLDHLESLLVGLDVRGETTLITYTSSVRAVLGDNDGLEVVVDLSPHAHGLGERRGANGEEHELLEGVNPQKRKEGCCHEVSHASELDSLVPPS